MMQDNQYLIDGSRMALFIKAFSENVDADFFLVDQSGAEMISTYSIEEDENPSADIKSRKNISSEAMQQALSGYFSATGTMNGLYSSNYYIIGVPIVTTNSSGQQVAIGAVFAASDLKVLDVFRDETIKMFLLAAVAAFMVSFCIVWTFSYKLAKPLREMALQPNTLEKEISRFVFLLKVRMKLESWHLHLTKWRKHWRQVKV